MKRYIIIVLILLVTCNIFAEEIEKIQYKNEILGFSIDYFKNWNIITADEYYKNLKNLKLKNEQFTELLQKTASIPFFSIMKYEEPYPEINPTLKINARLYGNLKGVSLAVLANTMLDQFKIIFEDFEIVENTCEKAIGNTTAVYFSFSYKMNDNDDNSYAVFSEIYLIDRIDYFFIIGIGNKDNDLSNNKVELQEMVNTIIIE